ncbi:MAG TPA: pre-peptidase C-terminal domain-containing protein [Allosphingosinicella sp.]|nr:pre-peptidase C-terminal domain-containing protein [Allosphingosinicella sp.]
MAGTQTVAKTGDQNIDGLLQGNRWDPLVLTYSFPTSGGLFGTGYGGGEPGNAFEALSAGQRAVVRNVYDMIESVTNLRFTLTTETASNHAVMRFAMSDEPPTASGYYPNPSNEGGDAWFNNSSGTYDNPVFGNFAYHTFIHEIGHTLGLKHGHEDFGNGPMTAARDSMEYSVMTYRSYAGQVVSSYQNETWGYAQTLMIYDIAALQHMYGADFTTNGGNSIYRWNATTGQMSINGAAQDLPGGNRSFMTMWDGGGTDTYDLSNYGGGVTIDLRPGEWTTTSSVQLANLGDGNFARGNIANALLFEGDQRSLIENAIGGGGSDTIFGNQAANTLTGGAGSDVVVLAGTRSDYTFSGTAANLSAVGFGVTDTIRSAESIRFLGSGQQVTTASLLTASDDDFRDTIADTSDPFGALAINDPKAGRIGAAGDTDVFRIQLIAGRSYTFDLLGAATGRTLGDPVLQLRNSAGTLLQTNDDFNTTDSRIVFTPSTGGTYYLTAGGFGSATGTYAIRARRDFDDLRDTKADTSAPIGALPTAGNRQGAIEEAGDRDVFAVTLVRGQRYAFELDGTDGDGGTLADPLLQLHNGGGTLLASNNNSGGTPDARILFTATTGGTFYLTADGVGAGTGTYTLRSTLLDDYRDTITDASAPLGALPSGGTKAGTLELGGDKDVFAVTLTAGQNYTFDLRGSAGGGGTLGDPVLELRNSAGTLLAANDDFNGLDSRIIFTATASGTYYLTAAGFETATGSYRISSRPNFDDLRDTIGDTTAPLGVMAVNDIRQGAIEAAGDDDIFEIGLLAGETYVVDLRGSASNGGTLEDPLLQLLDRFGNVLLENDDFGFIRDSQLFFTVSVTDTYYLAASAFDTFTGSYTLSTVLYGSGASADLGLDRADAFLLPHGAPPDAAGLADRLGIADWGASERLSLFDAHVQLA